MVVRNEGCPGAQPALLDDNYTPADSDLRSTGQDWPLAEIVARVIAMVPMARSLGLSPLAVGPQRAVLTMPDQLVYRNHVGGPHAGALFTLAEGAAGALLFGNFFEYLDELTPLVTRAEIKYLRPTTGPARATATMDRTPDEILAEFRSGQRPEWPVAVEIAMADGSVTGIMIAHMTIVPAST